jgi:hypothetical protein
MALHVSKARHAWIGTAALVLLMGHSAGAVQSPATPPLQTPPATQTPSTPPTPSTTPSTDAKGAVAQVTVSGCVVREADYRRSAGLGRGGAASSGIGLGNEFILANAMPAASTVGSATATSGAGASSAVGTSGTGAGTAYELTGRNEGQAETFIGKRVEITGTMKATDRSATGTPGGPTATVLGSQDLKLQELEVSSIREATGTCTAAPPLR